MKTRQLFLEGILLNNKELYEYLEKFGVSNKIKANSEKDTYPIPRMIENYNVIKQVYNLLNENVKSKIEIHPAGEWLLDNFYIIEEVTKSIEKEMTLKKYTNLVGIGNGRFQGFARCYVIASILANYTDNNVSKELLEESLASYQTKKSLSMDEIWNIGVFLQIAIIENIRQICENIFIAQREKFKVESIIERLVENKPKSDLKYLYFKGSKNIKIKMYDIKYPFIEYLSYKLKKYGKKTEKYLKVLEEETLKAGVSISDVIKREHFDIAVNKISIGNAITTIKRIQRINFLDIFEKINSVEEVLKEDPAKVYDKMDYKTKEDYRNKIKQISKKTKISEIYIARKLLELAKEADFGGKKSHIGYYLQDENIKSLYNKLQVKVPNILRKEEKAKLYVLGIMFFTIVLDLVFAWNYPQKDTNLWIKLISFIVLLVPISELVIEIIQYILSKIIKPKIIPKLDFSQGIPEDEATFVIIPTIVSSKQKAFEMFKNLEVDYLANKSENVYFCLLADCKESSKEKEDYDEEVIRAGIEEAGKLNKKYPYQNFPKFHFIYRKRKWNENESSYLGWERKRGAITDFTEYLLGHLKEQEILSKFNVNTICDFEKNLPKIKYIITLDSDTDLSINSAHELIGTMAHILNKPEVENGVVKAGYGLIQPRVGINLDISYKTLFTKIFAGMGGIDCYSNAISDIYQDNFGEGIFTGKGIFDLKLYSELLKKEIPENTVLSHDLLEGSYLRCGLATDIIIMDGYPCKTLSFLTRLSRWIRGDWQILAWLKNSKLNLLSKFKIFDNLRRSVFEIFSIISLIYFFVLSVILNKRALIGVGVISLICVFPYILEIINNIIFKKEGEQTQKTFTPKIGGYLGAVLRAVITFSILPYKAYISLKAILVTIYRLNFSKKHLLKWMTSEEAEKNSKADLFSHFKVMVGSTIFGLTIFLYFLFRLLNLNNQNL